MPQLNDPAPIPNDKNSAWDESPQILMSASLDFGSGSFI